MNDKKMNVVWFLVDSVRNYHTDADDRGRLDIMDEIAKESVEFTTVVTSAPSTVMAVSSMMTGWPSVYMSRTYYGFKHDRTRFPSLGNLLEDKGYSNYHILFFPEGRELLNGLMYPIDKKFWTKNVKGDEFWTNDQVNSILFNILDHGLKEPFFLHVNYNCRHDPLTSQKVYLGINEIKRRRLWDNSIFILNSDHGYPDPKRQIKFKELREKGHDLIMTDDNILVPLFIKFPGCKVKKIETTVSSLNIVPTVLEILGFEYPDYIKRKFQGKSMLSLIKGEKIDSYIPLVRIDNRYIYQPDRISAIRSDKYKYVYSWGYDGESVEEFFDIVKDKFEERNLINTTNDFVKKEIEKFRKIFQEYEAELFKYQDEYIESKIKKIVSNYNGINSILFYSDCNEIFCAIVINSILDNFQEVSLSVLTKTIEKRERLQKKLTASCNWIDSNNIRPGTRKKSFDLAIVPLVSRNEFLNRTVVKKMKDLNIREVFYTNYNLEPEMKARNWIISGLWKLYKMKDIFKHDPKTFFYDLIKKIKTINPLKIE